MVDIEVTGSQRQAVWMLNYVQSTQQKLRVLRYGKPIVILEPVKPVSAEETDTFSRSGHRRKKRLISE